MTVVTLGARDFDALRAFYRALGWPETPNATEDWTAFQTGGTWLCLYPLDKLAAEARLAPREDAGAAVFGGFSLAVNVEAVEDVDRVWRAMVDAGARVLTEPTTRDYGVRSGYVADPEGNAWEGAYAPGSALDDRGLLAL
ncbi:MAG: glyoxalase [Dehalococcoidia bacterium]|nr:glyoxalase [Dehalococcoidia bacterium]